MIYSAMAASLDYNTSDGSGQQPVVGLRVEIFAAFRAIPFSESSRRFIAKQERASSGRNDHFMLLRCKFCVKPTDSANSLALPSRLQIDIDY